MSQWRRWEKDSIAWIRYYIQYIHIDLQNAETNSIVKAYPHPRGKLPPRSQRLRLFPPSNLTSIEKCLVLQSWGVVVEGQLLNI